MLTSPVCIVGRLAKTKNPNKFLNTRIIKKEKKVRVKNVCRHAISAIGSLTRSHQSIWKCLFFCVTAQTHRKTDILKVNTQTHRQKTDIAICRLTAYKAESVKMP